MILSVCMISAVYAATQTWSYRKIKKRGENSKLYLAYIRNGNNKPYLACIIVLGDLLLVFLFLVYMANT